MRTLTDVTGQPFRVTLTPSQEHIIINWLRYRNAGQDKATEEWSTTQAFEYALCVGVMELAAELSRWEAEEAHSAI